MKSIINFVLRNKFAVWLLTLIVAASGIYSSTRMKMETIPDISIPYLMVMTAYPGATAEEVMDKVSIPIEKTVENLEGVKAVYSTSYAGLSSIQVEYDYEQNMADARRELQNAIDDVTLPDEAMEPKISGISMNMMPVLAFSVSSSKEDIAELTSTVEDILVPRIEKIEGVASVTVTGQQIEEAELKFDGQKLASLG
ncbi:efflux RND transporter permease subunit, partial [Caldibacillus debilis]